MDLQLHPHLHPPHNLHHRATAMQPITVRAWAQGPKRPGLMVQLTTTVTLPNPSHHRLRPHPKNWKRETKATPLLIRLPKLHPNKQDNHSNSNNSPCPTNKQCIWDTLVAHRDIIPICPCMRVAGDMSNSTTDKWSVDHNPYPSSPIIIMCTMFHRNICTRGICNLNTISRCVDLDSTVVEVEVDRTCRPVLGMEMEMAEDTITVARWRMIWDIAVDVVAEEGIVGVEGGEDEVMEAGASTTTITITIRTIMDRMLRRLPRIKMLENRLVMSDCFKILMFYAC
mmetsp:Transcript_2936/g.4437  ORF Transcript_2936/g.4437 Transcript_2936/m.4437 type:complete len:283 (-) Transcript_2936:54-902(-)